MTKQTAVQWIVDVYEHQGHLMPAQVEQALQMEREQIEEAWLDGDNSLVFSRASDYYTQTYGGTDGR